MAHLLRPRVGWEGERLAHHLLSRFSFVAQPTGIADDLGSDFFCTVFDIVNSRPPTIEPRSSFAIQVKSGRRRIAAHNKIDYLLHLEIPFFIGVVSQSEAKIDVYTAERLPLLFASFGEPKKLCLRLVARERYHREKYCREAAPEEFEFDCPYVSTFTVTDDRGSLQSKVDELTEICRRASSNIATRRIEEHIYDIGEDEFSIVAGPGSALYFRHNFCKRLAEVFYNLYWILDKRPQEFNRDEFKLYESVYDNCESLYSSSGRFHCPPALGMASNMYKRLKERLDQTIPDDGTSANR